MAELSEFSLISRYFSAITPVRDDVVRGIGDDCALLVCPPNRVIAVSIDTLVEGIHFFSDVCPKTLGHKSLAVGLSDLAAMGATPAWFTLALSLPEVNEQWLQDFSEGLAELANQHHIQLVGGDTTKGPLTISIQVHGFVEPEHALQRNGARVGDLVYVTGTLGDAGAGLQAKLNPTDYSDLSEQQLNYLFKRLEQPTPRVKIGEALLGLASAAIDISDGLSADLSHILEQSGVGATITLNVLPLSDTLKTLDIKEAIKLVLTSGDDYELCFTVPVEHQKTVEELLGNQCSLIGVIDEETGLRTTSNDETKLMMGAGYDHFS